MSTLKNNKGLSFFIRALRNAIIKEKRRLKGPYLLTATIIGGLLCVFYLYTLCFGIFSIESHRAVFFGAALALIFLWFPATNSSAKDRFTVCDVVFALLIVGVSGYFIYFYSSMAMRAGTMYTHEVVMGWIAIILSLEAARRSVGVLLPVISILALLYCLPAISRNLPDIISHRGMDYIRIARFMYSSIDGLFGVVTNTLATYVLPFIIFGSFLKMSGAGGFFIELPYALLGRTSSGSALVAVAGSALMGSVVGSPLGNVVATGTFTIPLMKKSGYSAEEAGAVETAASSGSMFMPPVMGAAVFFMVEFTGIPYIEIIKVALIPALLYYLGVGLMVHLYAKKRGIQGESAENLPKPRDVLKKGWFYPLPLVVLLYFLINGYSPSYAAFFGCITCIVVSFARKDTMMTFKRLWETLVSAAESSLVIAGVTGAVGIIVGMLTLTGLGLRFASVVIAAAGGSLILTILLVAIAAMFLGMGAPISAVYAILAVIAPAALMELGVSMISAHLLLVWYSQLSGITPPVCLVAYAAAAIAEGNPFNTGKKAFLYGSYLIMIPLLFVYTPILLEGTMTENIIAIATSAVGVMGWAVLMQNYLNRKLTLVEKILLAVGVFLLFTSNFLYNGIGMVLVLIALAIHLLTTRQKKTGGRGGQIAETT